MKNNNPIQVVLNTNSFIETWDRPPGGSNKDFFAGNDAEFIIHKENIQRQLNDVKALQINNNFSKMSFAKVTLRETALAKSHRPTSQIFKSGFAPVIGAGNLGELYVELTPERIDKIENKISQAEEETKYKFKDGKEIPKPSTLRSEVGSIDKISPYTASDKRSFSVSEALDWLSTPGSGSAYIVELFEAPSDRKDWDILPKAKYDLFKTFFEGLQAFGNGILAHKINQGKGSAALFGIKLEDNNLSPNIQLQPSSTSSRRSENKSNLDLNADRHNSLINFLDIHPLVKKINLPPIVRRSYTSEYRIREKFTVPEFKEEGSYPKICVVDGGVSDVYKNWIEDRWGLVSPDDKDENHGTFIAGLTLFGQTLNGGEVCRELDGCKIIDLDILPMADRYGYYFSKPLEFFSELEIAVKELKARTGVRIFNFSLNFSEHASTSGYSLPAQILDKIAEENDVIFIISAGNTDPRDFRKEWPDNNFDALKILATSRNDTIKKPAESCRNLSVAAVNPPNLEGIVPYALSNYSCRGPGLKVGLKPDLAHIGGAGTKVDDLGHGLISVNPDGFIVDGCGTSYATPQVAKTLASIDNLIEGDVSRETLIGLGIHHANMPESLSDKKLNNITKHLIGFGIPDDSNSMLDGDPHSITMIFANRAKNGRRMSFNFSWPECLVKDGKCIGRAKLTIVSSPGFDYGYGSEFVRVNINAALRQQQNDGKYKGRLDAIYTPTSKDAGKYEKDQIEHSFKWSPVKVYEKTFKRGVGPTTDWKLEVEYLTRDGVKMPSSGVPFTVLLTISDPDKNEMVYDGMRQNLQSLGVTTADIKTATRISPRI